MVSVAVDAAAKVEPEREEIDGERGPDAEREQGGETIEPRPRGLRQRLEPWWQQFHSDVFGEHASVGPLAGWLLLGLLAVVTYLTLVYAEGAAESDGAERSNIITVEAGYWTLGIVTLLALAVGFAPQLGRQSERWRASLGRRRSGSAVMRAADEGLRAILHAVWRLPSLALNLLDYVLACIIAPLAGVTQKSTVLRYAWGAIVILGIPASGLLAPPPFGLYAVVVGMLAIIAIARRWSWIEANGERAQFEVLIWRGEREQVQRDQDLRDEALVGLICLLLLIPLALQQVQAATCANDACAFRFGNRGTLPAGAFSQFMAWLGFFGAELAKAVPFVDWSEVFNVANEFPIKPRTALGAQVIFGMRATLDLLLLGAIVQALQITGRQRVQQAAHRAGLLPVLPPIIEAQELRSAGNGIEDALGLPPAEQPSIAAFQAYDRGRLRQIVSGDSTAFDPVMRKAAAAVLARQHWSPDNNQWLADRAKSDRDPTMRSWLLTLASGLAPDADPARREAERERLKALLADVEQAVPMQAAAARALGRMGHDDATANLLLERLNDRDTTDTSIRAAATVALAKLGIADAMGPTHELAGTFHGASTVEERMAAMATAFACARQTPSPSADRITDLFDPRLREHVLRAARIQPEPMDIAAARDREPGAHLDQLVRIAPGEGPFPVTFRMGSPDDDDTASGDEKPATPITMKLHFALGRYAVTRQEYQAFCRVTDRAWEGYDQNDERGRYPATGVTWRDAIAYCSWLERITGEAYRLPTEAEWEYACRAGTKTRYSFGDDDKDLGDYAWFTERNSTHPVGEKKPNPWGLYDMHGNVWEWCTDPWHDNYNGHPGDGSVWLPDGDFRARVLRGGSWVDDPLELRSANRFRLLTGRIVSARRLHLDLIGEGSNGGRFYGYNLGFRVGRTLSARAGVTTVAPGAH